MKAFLVDWWGSTWGALFKAHLTVVVVGLTLALIDPDDPELESKALFGIAYIALWRTFIRPTPTRSSADEGSGET